MSATYAYDPAMISGFGKDRMRFELGDTMVDGGAETCALCDEEYAAVLTASVYTSRSWKKAKLRCLESIMHRFAFEADTKVGPLSLSLGERAKLWRDMYERLRGELKAGSGDASAVLSLAVNPGTGEITPPYFYAGMMSHEEAQGEDI